MHARKGVMQASCPPPKGPKCSYSARRSTFSGSPLITMPVQQYNPYSSTICATVQSVQQYNLCSTTIRTAVRDTCTACYGRCSSCWQQSSTAQKTKHAHIQQNTSHPCCPRAPCLAAYNITRSTWHLASHCYSMLSGADTYTLLHAPDWSPPVGGALLGGWPMGARAGAAPICGAPPMS